MMKAFKLIADCVRRFGFIEWRC